MKGGRWVFGVLACVGLFACDREERRLNSPPLAGPTAEQVQQATPTASNAWAGPYDHNAYGTTEGQLLFESMNCSGCHSNGGGGMGPPLMDDKWIYGSRPEQIFLTIADGRPNGMPAWRSRLNNDQIWQLVAYVRSLSGLTPKGDRPSREDHMMVKPAPNQTPKSVPRDTGAPAPPGGR